MHKKIQIKYKKIDKKWFFIILVVWILSFFINVWAFLFLGFFCFANALLLTIDRYINAPIDLELSTFSSILMTLIFGLKWGIANAILTKMAAIVHNKKFTMDHVVMIGGYIIAALMASIIPGDNILFIGLFATIIVNIYVMFVSKFITMLSTYEIIMYGLSNLIFNIVLFIGFSEFILKLMQVFI